MTDHDCERLYGEMTNPLMTSCSVYRKPIVVSDAFRRWCAAKEHNDIKFLQASMGEYLTWVSLTPVIDKIEEKMENAKEAMHNLLQLEFKPPAEPNQWSGIWFNISKSNFYEINDEGAWRIDPGGDRMYAVEILSSGYVTNDECWLDEKQRGDERRIPKWNARFPTPTGLFAADSSDSKGGKL